MAKIILSDGAEKDLQDDLIWYKNKQKDLSAKYLTDYLDTEKGIENNPKGFPMFRLGFRKALFKLFRHAVIYGLPCRYDMQ